MRIIDGLARDKNIDKDLVVEDLETAMVSAVRKAYGQEIEVTVSIDRLTGEIQATREGVPVDMKELGRIAAQTAKQVMIQKIRDAERGSIFQEFLDKKGMIVTGTVSRFEGGALVVNLGRTEGFLPRSEQIPGETHQPGERIRVMVLEVREAPHQVKIILSRSHPDLIRRLFEQEVPEVQERVIEIKALAREAGYRTKVAVASIDTKVDAVGACVGVRGSRIKNIVEELGGEKIDIVRWNESSQILITNALKPAEVQDIALCFELGRASAVVQEDQLSLAIGKRGQNVRLAARLTGWDIDIITPKEYNQGLERLERTLKSIEGVDAVMLERFSVMGLITVMDVEEVGPEPLVTELSASAELAQRIVDVCAAESKIVQEEMAAAKAAKEVADREAAAAAAAAAAAGISLETTPAATDAPVSEMPAAESPAADESSAPAEGGETAIAPEPIAAAAEASEATGAESAPRVGD